MECDRLSGMFTYGSSAHVLYDLSDLCCDRFKELPTCGSSACIHSQSGNLYSVTCDTIISRMVSLLISSSMHACILHNTKRM